MVDRAWFKTLVAHAGSPPSFNSARIAQMDVSSLVDFQSAPRRYLRSYEDWQLCFPLLCEEEPAEAGQLFDDMREFMQVTMEVRSVSRLHDMFDISPMGSNAARPFSRIINFALVSTSFSRSSARRRTENAPMSITRARTFGATTSRLVRPLVPGLSHASRMNGGDCKTNWTQFVPLSN
jgi:hypothetical protein